MIAILRPEWTYGKQTPIVGASEGERLSLTTKQMAVYSAEKSPYFATADEKKTCETKFEKLFTIWRDRRRYCWLPVVVEWGIIPHQVSDSTNVSVGEPCDEIESFHSLCHFIEF